MLKRAAEWWGISPLELMERPPEEQAVFCRFAGVFSRVEDLAQKNAAAAAEAARKADDINSRNTV